MKFKIRKHFLFLLLFSLLTTTVSAGKVRTGVEVLKGQNFAAIKGKRVGLITNPTGVDRNLQSTIDLFFHSKEIKLIALYGPEHGVRGDYSAGTSVSNFKDSETGLPVYSIYGKTRKPTPEMLRDIDVLVYDIQDIGSRSYTYISSLGLAMEAAAENSIEFVVLDRPNPLGGLKMEGCLTEPAYTSFVSQFPIPYIHGLTVGELAIYLNEEGLLANKIKCKLIVIPMKGWKRKLTFDKTGLPWIPSSPHIPQTYSPVFYPISGILGELYVMNIGVGYTLPFQLFAAEWINADSLAKSMNELKLPGMQFRPIHFTPYYSVSKDRVVHGIQVYVTDYKNAELSLVQFYVLQECHKLWPEKNVFELCEKSRLNMFDKVCGTDRIRLEFSKTFFVESIRQLWEKDIDAFRVRAKKYFLY
ncbi:MAG: DUF1343 domain-containing protein [Bacteroidia bacterium]|nr:DUF1343 domain-containing protein [Bacteroidia bacterium]